MDRTPDNVLKIAEQRAAEAYDDYKRLAKEYDEARKRWYTAVEVYDKHRDYLIESVTGRKAREPAPAYLNAHGTLGGIGL